MSFLPRCNSQLPARFIIAAPSRLTLPRSRWRPQRPQSARMATTATFDPASPPVAIIVCSTRKPRAGGQATQFVQETLAGADPAPAFTPHLLDLADWPLPFLDEPGVPSQVERIPDGYVHEHTRNWSREISRYAGYVFVTPQYNAGYPAVLKNGLDYLFKEWNGKPAAIISYGGRGGTQSAAQLRQVLGLLRMRVADTMPGLAFPKGAIGKMLQGESMGVTGPDSLWNEYRPQIIQALQELATLLHTPPEEAKKV